MSARNVNERKFDEWETTADNGRLYKRKVEGRHGWHAIYYKETDSEENTIRFWQEIFDTSGELMEIHEKFPVDKGHKKLR
ncbi:MAG: hypothetical protein EP314_02405 [Bacteroidetes bacterium]|nr:MAG: hypothetical protein EP314_02405 [Bacteroidota bacterium]